MADTVTSTNASSQHSTSSTTEYQGEAVTEHPDSLQPTTASPIEQELMASNRRRWIDENERGDRSDGSGSTTDYFRRLEEHIFDSVRSPESVTSNNASPQHSMISITSDEEEAVTAHPDSPQPTALSSIEQERSPSSQPSTSTTTQPDSAHRLTVSEALATTPQPCSSTKRKNSSPKTPAKKSRESSGSQNEDSDTCPICFEPWTNSGEHKLCCLKCGHLFGESCILRWLRTAKKCTQCNAPARKQDIRVLYAKNLRAKDTTELTEATRLYENASKACREKEMELAKVRMQYQMAMAEVGRLTSKMKEMRDSLVASSSQRSTKESSSRVCREFLPMRTVNISNSGGCRILDFHSESRSIAISFPSPHTQLQPGFALRKLSLSDGRLYQWGVLHKKMIKDFKISPCNQMVLSASQDKTLRITNWENLMQMHKHDLMQPVWSCCWNSENSNFFYAGLNSGQINCYDIRQTVEPVHKIINSDSRSPVVTLYHIPHSDDASTCGLLAHNLHGVMFWSKVEDTHYVPHMLPLPPGNCAGLQYSHTQKQCLITFRQGRSYSHVTQTVCNLTISGPSSNVTADIVANFHGGQTHKMLARHAIFSTSTEGNLIAFGDEAKNSVQLYQAKAGGSKLQTLNCGNPTLDILPITTDETTLLAALTDKDIKLFNQH